MDDPVSSDSFGRALEFEAFVRRIIEAEPDVDIVRAPSSRDHGVDIAARHDGRLLLVEVKLATPQTSYRLEQAIQQLKAAAENYQRDDLFGPTPELILAFPGVLADTKRTKATRSQLEIWDGPFLRDRANQLGIRVPPYVAESLGSDSSPSGLRSVEEDRTDWSPGYELFGRLDGIAPGRADWPAYEKLCEELLNFLFVPPLNTAIPQSRDEQNANRRDFILPNYAPDGFWGFIRNHYEAHYIPAEIKNLTGPPAKNSILQVANYLNVHGTGLFGLILARKEMDSTAQWIRREQWVLHSKLIIGLDDDDLRQMVRTKLAGSDPAELIRQKIEDFRLKI